MPITLTLVTPDGQPAQVLTVPTCWADVTLAQFVALFAPVPNDPRTMAELLLGLEAGALNQLAADDVPLISGLLDFVERLEEVTGLLLPPGQNYEVGQYPYGCLLLCMQHFEANAERPGLASLPYVLAVYRCHVTYGSTDRVAQVLEAVLAAPVTEVYAEGAAFLARCKSWPSSSAQTPKTPAITKMPNSTPVWKRWPKSLARHFRSMRSRAATF